MSQPHVRVTLLARYSVPPAQLWAAVSDHKAMSRWADVAVEVISGPTECGVGTVRRVRAFGLAVDEEIVIFEPPRRMVYRVIRGLPLSYHHSEVRVSAWGSGGSELWWDMVLASRIPWFARATGEMLRRGLNQALQRLAHEVSAAATPLTAAATATS